MQNITFLEGVISQSNTGFLFGTYYLRGNTSQEIYPQRDEDHSLQVARMCGPVPAANAEHYAARASMHKVRQATAKAPHLLTEAEPTALHSAYASRNTYSNWHTQIGGIGLFLEKSTLVLNQYFSAFLFSAVDFL